MQTRAVLKNICCAAAAVQDKTSERFSVYVRILITAFSVISVFSAAVSAEEVKAPDNANREWLIKAYASIPSTDFWLNGDGSKSEVGRTSVNSDNTLTTMIAGLEVVNKSFSVQAEIPLRGLSSVDFVNTCFFGGVGYEFMFQRYKGFYDEKEVSGPQLSEPGKDHTSLVNTKLNFYWFVFDQYSFTDDFIQKTGSRHFTWSPYLKLSPGYIRMRSDQPFVPQDLRSYYDESCRDTSKADFYTLAATAGLACNIPVDTLMRFFEMGLSDDMHVFISPMVDIGYALDRHSYNGKLGTKKGTGGNMALDLRLSAGYSDDILMAGGWFCNENQMCRIGNMDIQISNLQLMIYAGIRL